MNLDDFYLGKAFDAYEYFGAHKENNGIIFRTYAPNAKKIFVTGEFNNWRLDEMQQQYQSGIYIAYIENAKIGQMYKYVVQTNTGRTVYHCDPYGFGMQLRPDNASYIVDLLEYTFHDSNWLKRRTKCFDSPLNIYEVHLGSWLKNQNQKDGCYRYNEIADKLINYVKANKYTHIEFLPLSEHPADCSWGYQTTGFFSPTSRYGTARELMELIDKCHQSNIGVIMDFVPVHFAIDDYGLNTFDGTPLYEYPYSDIAYSEWGTCNFNFNRGEVRTFLQSCANYWLKIFHFDGIRMDAISRAIYWQGDSSRGENIHAVNFLKVMNSGLNRLHPTAILIAEDSTAFPKVTYPTEKGGLGFDYKWDLGWMNDTLKYLQLHPNDRLHSYNKLKFSMHYFYNEHYILPFSHDEVVHCKGAIINKMWGEVDEKWQQLRALYMYMCVHPGKKLNFMGNELAQNKEWNEKTDLDWKLLENPIHKTFQEYVRRLNEIYLSYPELHVGEFDKSCFKWIEANTTEKSILAFERGNDRKRILAIFNFSSNECLRSTLPMTKSVKLNFLLSSERNGNNNQNEIFSEYNQSNHMHQIKIDIPAFCGKLFVYDI